MIQPYAYVDRVPGATKQEQILYLWRRFAHVPEHRAIQAAKYCQCYAPELAWWLNDLILAETPDCPGRKTALARLKIFCRPR